MDETYIKTLTEVEQRSKSNTKRLDKLEQQTDAINKLATSVATMATEQKHQTESMTELKNDVKNLDTKVENLESKPGQRWEKLIEVAIATIIGLVIGYALKGIF